MQSMLRLSCALASSLLLASCYKDIGIKDENARALRISAEGKIHPRVMLSGKYDRHSVSHDNFELETQSTSRQEVLRVNDTYWYSPSRVGFEADVHHLHLDAAYLVIDKDLVRFHVGGGLRYVDTDITVTGRAKKANADYTDWGLGANIGVRLNFSDQFAMTVNLNQTVLNKAGSADNHDLGLNFHWQPLAHLQFDLGLFEYGLNPREEINMGLNDYGTSCIVDDPWPDCPDFTDGNSDTYIRASGLRAGITLRF